MRALVLAYGVVAYGLFLVAFVYAIGFLADAGVPKGIDDGLSGPIALAIVVDVSLLLLFAVQHNLMARPWFKTWWARFVPSPIERSTYVALSSLILL
jgi:protein-S-isoprenylcysteine O-methyltransferase Ste14